MQDKIVLIDGNSVFYRSFFALPLLSNEKGEYSNAVYGFANQIVKIITELKPTHIIVAFDAGKKTFRNNLYSEYKATRKPMADELKAQIEPLRRMLSLMNIKFVDEVGYEGDDMLGMLCTKFKDVPKIIVTGDRDTLQLIDTNTTIYFTKKGVSEVKIMGEQELKDEYNIPAKSIIDLKALQGDTSDNIPGAKGVGPKTALSLITKYQTIENLYEHIDEIDAKLKDKLIENKDNVFLSKQLATIVTDKDIQISLDDAKYEFPFSEDVYKFFLEYSFRTLLKRPELFGEKYVSLKQVVSVVTEKIDTREKLQNMLLEIEKTGQFAFFIDTNNNISISCDGQKEYIAIEKRELFSMEISHEKVLDRLRSYFFSSSYKKVFFDAKSVFHYISKFGEFEVNNFVDISIAKHLVSGLSIKNIYDIGVEDEKSTPVASVLIQNLSLLRELENMDMMSLYTDVELPLVKVLYSMEKHGFKVDTVRLEEIGAKLSSEILSIKKQIFDMANGEFNLNSPKQLSVVLYDKLKLAHSKKKSTNAEALEKIIDDHPIIELLLRYRKIEKLRSTYIDGLRVHIDKNNFVHTSFKQTLTTTGRLSSVEPNLQNIPIRSEESKQIRSIYTASSPSHVLIDADYSQIELRLLAHFSEDEFFINAFNNHHDIHTSTAMQVFKVDDELSVTPLMRRIAKVVNFGIIYGISEFGLATDLKCTNRQAREFIENFFNLHPKVRSYLDNLVLTARDTGRVQTLLGRTRAIPEINNSNFMVRSRAERASQNMPLQGSAADIIKIAMINVKAELEKRKLKAKLIMQVHDELIIDCPKTEVEEVSQILKDKMENAVKLRVPLEVEIQSAYNWSSCH